MNLTINQRGLLLVALPLVLELCLLLMVSFFELQAERAAEQEARCKMILAQSNILLQDLILLSSSSTLFTLTVANRYEQQSLYLEEQVRQGTEKLDVLVGNNRAVQERVQKLKATNTKLLAMIHQGRKYARKEVQENYDGPMDPGAVSREMVKGALVLNIGRVINDVRDLNELVIKQGAPLSALTRQWTGALHVVLILGIPISIFVSFLMSRYFTTTIRSRLDNVAANTRAFAKGDKMTAPLAGKDEIAELDTTFRQMAVELTESRRKERAIVDHAQDMICALTGDLQFLSANPASQQILGVASTELAGRNLESYINANAVMPLRSQLQSGDRTSEWTLETELELDCKDGSRRWTQWSFVWSPEEAQYFCICHDASKQKELENLKRDFVNMVSHDLRSPITSLHLFLDSMVEGVYGQLPENLRNSSQLMGRNLHRLLGLINNLLDVEKIEAGRMALEVAPQRVADIIEDQIMTLMPLLQAQELEVDLDLNSDLVAILDEARMHQVLGNLLSNAIKFSPKGSTIRIECEQVNTQVYVKIKDQGQGIAAEELPKLFERFQQAASAKSVNAKGTGLGLTLCKKIIELHGGQIGVESELGKGSCFWFKLPLVVDEGQAHG